MKRYSTAVLLLSLLLGISCSSEKKDLPAKAPTASAYAERHPALKNAKTVKYVIEQSFPEGAKVPLVEILDIHMKYAGLEVVSGEAAKSDVTLNIKVAGEAKNALYTSVGGRWTGAEVKGAVSLLAGDQLIADQRFAGSAEPQSLISGGEGSKPSWAPFDIALKKPGSFMHALTAVMVKAFGFHIIDALLQYKPSKEYYNFTLQDYVRSGVVPLLKAWPDDRAVGPLMTVLEFDESVVDALKKRGDSIVPTLLNALDSRQSGDNLKNNVIIALGKIKDARAVEPLIAILKKKELRRNAITALGNIKDGRAVKPLLRCLKDREWVVRYDAVTALGEIKDPRAIGPLIDALGDQVRDVRWAASKTLPKITGIDFGDDQGKWRAWWKENRASILK